MKLTESPRIKGFIDEWLEPRRSPSQAAAISQAATADKITAKIDEWEAEHLKIMLDAAKTALVERNAWTKWDTGAAILGLLLTIASDALPLASLLCPQETMPATAEIVR